MTETLASDRRAMLPFLPTLGTALVVAAASLLCRPATPPTDSRPTAPAMTVEAARVGADLFHPVMGQNTGLVAGPAHAPTLGTTESIPATLAFARLLPPAFTTDATARSAAPAASAARPTHVAVQSAAPALAAPRRPCAPPSRCAEARRGEMARGPSAANPARTTPEPASASVSGTAQPFSLKPEKDDGFLPKDALPYAASAPAWVDTVRRFGGRIGSGIGQEPAEVGGSVVELLASAR